MIKYLLLVLFATLLLSFKLEVFAEETFTETEVEIIDEEVRHSNNICRFHKNGTAVANPAKCNGYFVCINGVAVPKTCPRGHWFNPFTRKCDNTPNPDCNPHRPPIDCPPNGIHLYPHPDYCSKYYMCFAGTLILRYCADDLHFDPKMGVCNFKEIVQCTLELCPRYNDPWNITFIPSATDCEKFFVCYDGDPMELSCAPGIHWNQAIEKCDFPENANCTVTPAPPVVPDPWPQEIDCPSIIGIYFIEHPVSCSHYFICLLGHSILVPCIFGFQYDSNNFWCTHPHKVDCGDRVIQNNKENGNGILLLN